jgi:hypothetical protein
MKKNKWILASIICIVFIVLNLFILFNRYGYHLISNYEKRYQYNSVNGMYSVQIPKAWSVNELATPLSDDKYLITTFATMNSKIYMSVRKYNNPSNNLNELENTRLAIISKFSKFKIIDKKNTERNNVTIALLEYAYTRLVRNYSNHCYEYINPANGGYIFSLCAEESLWKYSQPMFIEMITSIAVENFEN